MASKYTPFDLKKFAEAVAAEHRAGGPAAPRVDKGLQAALADLERCTMLPTHTSLMPSIKERAKFDLAMKFLENGPFFGSGLIRFNGPSVVMVKKSSSKIYRVNIRLDGPYDIELNGKPVALKVDKWETRMNPFEWLKLHL